MKQKGLKGAALELSVEFSFFCYSQQQYLKFYATFVNLPTREKD